MRMLLKPINRQILIDIFVILILGLTPLLWFKGGTIIAGHDAGFPLEPISHFLDRLFVWTERMGFGGNQSFALGGFFLHGLEALVNFFTNSLLTTQKIVFIFWFTLPGLAMYFLASILFGRRYRLLPLFASVFYMFNHFLLQGWFIAERTKFSLYIALPVVLALLILAFEGKIKKLTASLLIGLTLFFFNGGGNLPLYGSMAISILIAFLYFTLVNKLSVRKNLLFLAGIFLSFSALNAYWLFPLISDYLSSYSTQVTSIGGIRGVLGWIQVISRQASFLNLFRLQGIPDWYNNPLHPYSNLFLSNILLIAASFIFPLLAFGSILIARLRKEKKYLIFFALLALIGMTFTAGSHSPLGFLYVFLVAKVPGFIIFRTPFYKFVNILFLSYSILIAFSLSFLIEKLGKKFAGSRQKFVLVVASVLVIVAVLFWNFPFFTASFFEYERGQKTTRIKVPDYVYQFGQWSRENSKVGDRFLLIPSQNIDNRFEAYNWGYWSFTTIPSLVTRSSFVSQDATLQENEKILVDSLYKKILTGDATWKKLARLLSINGFLVRDDFAWYLKGSPTSPPFDYEKVLKADPDLSLIRSFGPWKVYTFKEKKQPLFSANSKINFIFSSTRELTDLMTLEGFRDAPFVITHGITKEERESQFFLNSDQIFVVPSCVRCQLREEAIDTPKHTPIFLPGSHFYPIKKFFERREETKASTPKEKVEFYSIISLKRLLAIGRLVEEKRPNEHVLIAFSDYITFLDKISQIISQKQLDNDSLLRVVSFLELEKALFSNLSAKINKIGEFLPEEMVEKLDQIIARVGEQVWATENETEKKYFLEITKEGEYEVFVNAESLNSYFIPAFSGEIGYEIDGEKRQGVISQSEGGWLLLDKLFLKEGQHRLLVRDEQRINLFKQEKSRSGLATLLPDSTIYEIKSKDKTTCLTSKLIDTNPNNKYRVSFKYRNLLGSHPLKFGAYSVSSPFKPSIQGEELGRSNSWREFQTDYSPNDNSGTIIEVCNLVSLTQPIEETINQVSEINVRRISTPLLSFRSNFDVTETFLPAITTKKINQTKYKIIVSNATSPFLLNFAQRFDSNWRASIIENGKKDNFSPHKHLTINGYANAWMMTKSGDYQIILEYTTQRLFYFGAILSSLSFLTISGFLFLLIKKSKK